MMLNIEMSIKHFYYTKYWQDVCFINTWALYKHIYIIRLFPHWKQFKFCISLHCYQRVKPLKQKSLFCQSYKAELNVKTLQLTDLSLYNYIYLQLTSEQTHKETNTEPSDDMKTHHGGSTRPEEEERSVCAQLTAYCRAIRWSWN